MSIILFLVILAALIFFHELGHFLAAKFFRIRVDEFALGFPPRLLSFRYGETLYTLNLIPFGGFVKIFGEDPAEKILVSPDVDRSLMRKNRGIQASVILAGIIFNILFAWILISIALMWGLPAPADYGGKIPLQDQSVIITNIVEKSPADVAGFRPGDKIMEASAAEEKFTENTSDKLHEFIQKNIDEEITFTVKRSGETLTLTAAAKEGFAEERKIIGFGLTDAGILKLSFGEAFIEGAKETWALTKGTAVGLYTFLKQAILGKANLDEITGPVGIVNLVGNASHFGLAYLLNFTALISINLAIINVLPIPALDGGRLAVVGVEAILRRPLNFKIVNAINAIGFIALMFLMVLITYRDIARLFTN